MQMALSLSLSLFSVIHWFVDISIRLCVLSEPTNKNLYHTSRLVGCGLDLDWLAGWLLAASIGVGTMWH